MAERADLSASKVIKKERSRSNVSTPKSKKSISKDDTPVSSPNGNDFEAEYQVTHPTGDKMRDKVRKLLTDALFHKEEDLVDSRDAAADIAYAIEAKMFRMFGGTNTEYKSKYRKISFNLKDTKNRKLRMAVLHKHIPPSELLNLSDKELANDELKKTREEVHQKMTRDAMPYNKQEASTNMFKCGKCKERKCTYFQMQTRSADEPLTTFVSCVNCGNRWRF